MRGFGRIVRIWLLSTLGIIPFAGSAFASTYYIDFNGGNDSNSGTSKSTPWQRHPYMKGFAGSYSHAAGDRFIFRGGVTWNATALPLQPIAGGTSGNSDYYGVDTTWFTGASWTRPIFDGQYSTTLTGVANYNGSLIYLDGAAASNITIDNIEIAHLQAPSTFGPGLIFVGGSVSSVLINNIYGHGWNISVPSGTCDDSHGGVIANNNGSADNVDNSVFTNSEWTGVHQNGVAIRGISYTNTVIHDVAASSIGVNGTISGNTIYNVRYPSGNIDYDESNGCGNSMHTNTMYVCGAASIFNNLIYNTDAGTILYLEPNCGNIHDQTIDAFNNTIFPRGGAPAVLCDTEFETAIQGTLHVYNNTLNGNGNGAPVTTAMHAGNVGFKVLDVRNNYFITTNPNPVCTSLDSPGTCAIVTSLTVSNNKTQSEAQANAQGYVPGNNYAPTTPTGITVGAGQNLTNLCTGNDTALCRDTTMGAALSGNVVTGPGRTSIARPTSGAWDVGAYQYNTSSGTQPNPPANLTAVVH